MKVTFKNKSIAKTHNKMERTIRTIATVSFDNNTHKQMDDGRQTVRQDIESIRADNTDRYAPYGEIADNSVCWGKSTLAGQRIQTNKIDMFDNGSFENEDRFKRAFTKHKDDTDIHYNSSEPKIGKYNYGLTNSCILLGDDATLIHHFGNGNYKKSKFSVDKVSRENTITENMCDPSIDEIEQFLQHQYMLDPLYDQKTGRGTHLRIENLRRKNTPETFTQISRFMYGLYSPECHQKTIFKLYNAVNSSANPNTVDEYTIAPNDLSFGAKPCETNTIYVYRDDNDEDKYKYTQTKQTTKKELYQFVVKIFFFDESQAAAEKEIFGNTTHTERVGFHVRRAGRLVTGVTPKLWVLSTGAMRGKGIRIHIDIPPNEEADKDWCIGTFKKITDDTWIHFNSCLQSFIREEFNDNSRRLELDIKKKQTDFVKHYDEQMKKIKDLTSEEETKKILKETNNRLTSELDNKDGGVIQRKSGKAYTSIMNYINALEHHAKTIAPRHIVKNDEEPKIVSVSVAKIIVPQAKIIVPQAKIIVPQAKIIVPQAKIIVPQAKPIVPQAKPIVPQAKPIVPQAKTIVPQANPIVPTANPIVLIENPIDPVCNLNETNITSQKEVSFDEWLVKVGGKEEYLKKRYNIEKNL